MDMDSNASKVSSAARKAVAVLKQTLLEQKEPIQSVPILRGFVRDGITRPSTHEGAPAMTGKSLLRGNYGFT